MLKSILVICLLSLLDTRGFSQNNTGIVTSWLESVNTQLPKTEYRQEIDIIQDNNYIDLIKERSNFLDEALCFEIQRTELANFWQEISEDNQTHIETPLDKEFFLYWKKFFNQDELEICEWTQLIEGSITHEYRQYWLIASQKKQSLWKLSTLWESRHDDNLSPSR